MKQTFALSVLAASLLAGVVYAQLPKTKSAEGTKVYIEAPLTGATVTSPFTVKFGLKGMGVAPASINHPNTGHHHLLVDMEKLPDFSDRVAGQRQHSSFRAGSDRSGSDTCPPGRHTLQLVFADYLHIPHDRPIVSEKITITVK